jgi:sulfite reductase (ferredoxin)
VRADLDEATEYLARAKAATTASDRDLRSAIFATARALLPLFGVEARKDADLAAPVAQHLVAPGWLSADVNALLATALEDIPPSDLLRRAQAFHDRVLALHASLDSALRFQLKPLAQTQPTGAPPSAHVADLRGVRCPMNFVRAKVALDAVPIGEVLQVLLDLGEPANNVPASFSDQGQEIASMGPVGEHFQLQIRRTE